MVQSVDKGQINHARIDKSFQMLIFYAREDTPKSIDRVFYACRHSYWFLLQGLGAVDEGLIQAQHVTSSFTSIADESFKQLMKGSKCWPGFALDTTECYFLVHLERKKPSMEQREIPIEKEHHQGFSQHCRNWLRGGAIHELPQAEEGTNGVAPMRCTQTTDARPARRWRLIQINFLVIKFSSNFNICFFHAVFYFHMNAMLNYYFN